jgi:inhibitor of KinA sporulation pathway (predicted exonuclease)
MKILVIDLEATCWDAAAKTCAQPEVIEVGGCILDTHDLKVINSFSWIVRPELTEVSTFCTDLTSITPEQAAGGCSFGHAMLRLERVQQDNRTKVWASWGDWDREQLRRQCKVASAADSQVVYPMGRTHVNVKNLEAVLRGGQPKSLGAALRLYDLEFVGNPHCGVDDAVNAARLLALLIGRFRCGGSR